MKILYLIETGGRGGAETILMSLSHHFRDMGNGVVLGTSDNGWLTETMLADGFDVHVIPTGKEIAGFDRKVLRGVRELVQKYKPDVIHAFLFHMNFYGAFVGSRSGIPCIVSLRSKHYDFEKKRRRLAWKLIDKLASQITTASDDLADVLSTRCKIDRRRILAIPNGVDTSRFTPPADRNAVKQELGLPTDVALVGTVGRTHPIKGHEDLIEAIGILHNAGMDLACVIVGSLEEPVTSRLKARSAELGIESRVILPGLRSDAAKWLQAMDYFVLPSHSEGMSVALLEAMATGLPIVATNVGSNMQLLDGGKCGLGVPAHEPEVLADKLRSLIESPELSERLGEAARERVIEHYSRAGMFHAYLELYDRIARPSEKAE